ncbi:HD domain-containing protein [Paenibacillus gorillae]|uniref:HD domain-containing protein n=1 Tax=Paenibacillus gorillae TaxID=1243662 RepID=UPI0004BCCA30|nr:HD domain-containing protein [Paenibacillus gorillae]
MPDSKIIMDGASGSLWEPMWQLHTGLAPVEQQLLQSSWVRRLHLIHHCGPMYLNSQLNYSRLQHTLGVFATIAYFHPEDAELRAAALLHDIGHVPFSHTLERIEGIDHHAITLDRIQSAEITGILAAHGLDQVRLLNLITGETASLLRNRNHTLQLDHLDSWVRSAYFSGRLPVMPRALLSRLEEDDGYLYGDIETVKLVQRLIVEEAGIHASVADIGPSALVLHLVQILIDHGQLSQTELSGMTDDMIEQLLRNSEWTKTDFSRFINRPWELKVSRSESGTLSSESYEWTVKKLYLSMPLTKDSAKDSFYAETEEAYRLLQPLIGTYWAYWSDEY